MTEVGATPAAVEAATWPLRCTNCGEAAGPGSPAYACRVCGGLFDLSGPLRAPPSPKTARGGLGLLPDEFSPSASTEWITLGEGNTPLIAADVDGRPLHFKCEYLNPTGSFKDRGSSVLVSVLAASGVTSALEDSSGNAGASFAAYAARAGIRARLLVPEGASPRKLAQIAAYGAEVVRVPGPRSAAAG